MSQKVALHGISLAIFFYLFMPFNAPGKAHHHLNEQLFCGTPCSHLGCYLLPYSVGCLFRIFFIFLQHHVHYHLLLLCIENMATLTTSLSFQFWSADNYSDNNAHKYYTIILVYCNIVSHIALTVIKASNIMFLTYWFSVWNTLL